MTNITPEYTQLMEKELKRLSLAKAYIQRANDAGIPEEYQRIGPEEFSEMLFSPFYEQKFKVKDKHLELTNYIYKKPLELFNKKYILIDGGDFLSINRKRSGFAILYRMITCNSFGSFIQGRRVVHQLNSFNYEDESRNSFIETLASKEILFIGELNFQDFKPNLDGGSYLDDLLERRSSNNKTTIISFTHTLSSEREEIGDNRCGMIVHELMKCDKQSQDWQKKQKVLRIRIKD